MVRRKAPTRATRLASEFRNVALGALIALFAPAAGADEPIFVDLARDTGLDFVHFNGMTGDFYFPEMTGQGGALLDYDGDGDLDLYLVQGGMLGPGKTLADALEPPPPGRPEGDRLFRNDLSDSRLRFVDVTEASGISALGYGMGAATGDYDGDGDLDIYVTNYGPNQLLQNRGDGTFADVTAETGAGDDRWSTSALFFDYDADGLLDLYVVNYVAFDLERNPACYAASSRRDYCGPSGFPPQADRLLRNLGGGRFEDVTLRALAGARPSPGLGAAAADLDGDGRLDLYVANDGEANQLWINAGDGGFIERGLLAGVAVNGEGRAEASMGIDSADFDGDGDEDLFLTHLSGETNTLYVNDGSGLFEDHSVRSGLGAPSVRYTAFGTGWLDFDRDGWLDLMILNGAVRTLDAQARAGESYPLKQPNQLFRGDGDGSLAEVTAIAGAPFAMPEVSRGLAIGDLDNDGDEDAVQFNNNGPVRLLINRSGARSNWLGARPLSALSEATWLGTRTIAALADGRRIARRSRADGSYCSARDSRVILGIGEQADIARLDVAWPGGARSAWLDPPLGRYLTLYGTQ